MKSPTTSTPTTLAAELLAGVTPGPWESDIDCFDSEDGICAVVSNVGTTILFTSGTDVPLHREDDNAPWTAEDNEKRDAQWRKARESQAMRDAKFIAAAPTLVASLIAEVQRLEGALSHERTNVNEELGAMRLRYGILEQQLFNARSRAYPLGAELYCREHYYYDGRRGGGVCPDCLVVERTTLRASLAATEAERDVMTERIAAFVQRGEFFHDEMDLTDPRDPIGVALTETADVIRARSWRKESTK